ncbi:uncharacterized protein CELE_D2024.18 [Caenorhabditis elegans]|uniref:Uncharacterized protein n=1 Tax=Caenorhabditis elegans TaxID=6239 RepID=V6CLC5_CAEEL|nr:Uncharacterized protein CELE_D2024.18 [Caenorhabditis elegans]CDK13348.1 Uncharacterized protein CELE_D2024.18 [Caenorhabditis elegans]|eukprot:NP_001293697.1 Uncharacterized protein CELE_D2024.18 [Caenorhabditis elegans]
MGNHLRKIGEGRRGEEQARRKHLANLKKVISSKIMYNWDYLISGSVEKIGEGANGKIAQGAQSVRQKKAEKQRLYRQKKKLTAKEKKKRQTRRSLKERCN